MVPVRLITVLILVALGARTTIAQDAVAVVVHAAVQDPIDVATLRRVFLVRQRFWSDGIAVRAVNQPARSAVRIRFTREALGGTVQDYSTYWNDLWFHGTAPPATLASDQAVLLFVARTPGAIGYVDEVSVSEPPSGIRVALRLGVASPRAPQRETQHAPPPASWVR